MIAKAVVFLLFFVWAARSRIGAEALSGAVAADVFTWVAFGLMTWPFRRFRVTAGGLLEAALILAYLFREHIFDIPTDTESFALAAIFFFGFAVLKTAVWGARFGLEVSGVTERG